MTGNLVGGFRRSQWHLNTRIRRGTILAACSHQACGTEHAVRHSGCSDERLGEFRRRREAAGDAKASWKTALALRSRSE